MPKLQQSMITVLKKKFSLNTVRKRFLLRRLAYWIGLEAPEFGWNYEQLIKLSVEIERIEGKEGIVIAFKVSFLMDDIVNEAVDWIKEEFEECLANSNFFDCINTKVINCGSIVCFKIPNNKGNSKDSRFCICLMRKVFPLVYKVVIEWVLSKYYRQGIAPTAGIFVGDFDEGDIFLKDFLSPQYYEDTAIFLTDRAFKCAQNARISANFEKISCNSDFKENFGAWNLKYFWSFEYYDLIDSVQKFLDREKFSTVGNVFLKDDPFTKFAADSAGMFALVEIVRVFLCKRDFLVADEVLSNVLKIYPEHIVAKAVRMFIYFNQSFKEYHFSEEDLFFDTYINMLLSLGRREKSMTNFENFFGGLGLIYYGQALRA